FRRSRRPDVLRHELHRLVSPRCNVCRQDPQRRQACRSACGAAEEIRVYHQSQSRQANRPNDSAKYLGEGGQSLQVRGASVKRRVVSWIRDKEKHMKNKIAVLFVCAMLLALCFTAEAQQPTNLPRIGFATAGSASTIAARIEALRQGLRDLGYIEDKNIIIEWRFAEGKVDRLPALVAELVRLKVDVLLSAGAA